MRRIVLSAVVPAIVALSACASGAGRRPSETPQAVELQARRAVPVSDAEFAARTHEVLRSGQRTQERLELLAGVVSRQLERADRRFQSGHEASGVRALTGALLLMRVGELAPVAFETASRPLALGAAEVARGGDEGRALALYKMLEKSGLSAQERAEVRQHLLALKRWIGELERGGPLSAAGARQHTAVRRALLDASPDALRGAQDAVVEWMRGAAKLEPTAFEANDQAQREEAVQAYKALRFGTATLVGLYLRHGDAAGALAAIDARDLERGSSGLTNVLERAAAGDARAWGDLYGLYEQAASEASDLTIDGELARAASWGAALELYRTEPSSLRHSLALAELLVGYGMAEVVPLILAGALGDQPNAQELSFALALVLRGIIVESEVGQVESARRLYSSAGPILQAARAKRLRGTVRPDPVRITYVMGAIETQSAELGRALPLIKAAAERAPNDGEVLRILASIQRQQGAIRDALATLKRLGEISRARGDFGSLATTLLATYETYRDQGDVAAARPALKSALEAALQARSTARESAETARAERLVARALEHGGDPEAARRASERAWEASRADPEQVTATILDASRRALVTRDLRAARQAVQRAVDAQLGDEDLVYIALWLRMVERTVQDPGDGTVENAFQAMRGDARWPAVLRAWGSGKLDDAGLRRAATTAPERVEAAFYIALAARGIVASAELAEIASSEAIELIEVSMARDLVAPRIEQRLSAEVALP